ncbi:MAG: Ferredoxin, partial [Herbinix sp.]|nr:Ferredoxin [Herbinix sp.]
KKGFVLPYETMLVMPSNFLMKTPNQLTAKLFELLPIKIEHIVDDILSGVRERSNPKGIDRLLSIFGEIEKSQFASWIFGKHIIPNHNCNGCGLCASSCPRGNIQMVNHFPKVGAQCVFCLRCIYGCKRNALYPHVGRFIVIKDGYNIGQLEKLEKVSKSIPKEYLKRYAYSGIIKYVKEVEEFHKRMNQSDSSDNKKIEKIKR